MLGIKKKFFKADPDATGPFLAAEAYSKLRRETSNFKVDFYASGDDLPSDPSKPLLLKRIDKKLKPEELIGLVIRARVTRPGGELIDVTAPVCSVELLGDEGATWYVLYSYDPSGSNPANTVSYIPSTGSLYLGYVEDPSIDPNYNSDDASDPTIK